MDKANNYQENRLFILNDRQSLRINSELAMEIGLNESIVLLQLEYLASISGNAKDGKKWVYNSAQEWKDKYFGFWSIET
ncbi:MAG: DNA replication protein DnaD, partial [Candidatus Moranbacteria bacterium]|nr:DNA replication protein DnaD [Candidatus Moranbacteria bacterium]